MGKGDTRGIDTEAKTSEEGQFPNRRRAAQSLNLGVRPDCPTPYQQIGHQAKPEEGGAYRWPHQYKKKRSNWKQLNHTGQTRMGEVFKKTFILT